MGVKHVLKELVRSLQLSWQRRRFLHFGEGSHISPFGIYIPSCKIYVGNQVYIGPRAILSATEGLYIGDGVTIGPEFMVMGGDHNFRLVGKRIWEVKTGGVNEPVSIEDDVWIGGRVVVLKGVTIGEGSVVGAGSVVTRDVVPYSICAGNPARKIKTRFSSEELREHLDLVKSRYSFEELESRLYG